MSAGSYRDASKGGVHNLGGNIKEHTAACFHKPGYANGGAVRRYADGDSVMFGDAPANDMGPPESAAGGSAYESPGDSEQKMASETAASSDTSLSNADAKGGSSVDSGADSASPVAPAKAAGWDAGVKAAKDMYASARKNPVVNAINRAGEAIGGAKDPKAAADARTKAISGDTGDQVSRSADSRARAAAALKGDSDAPKKKRGRGGVPISDPVGSFLGTFKARTPDTSGGPDKNQD